MSGIRLLASLSGGGRGRGGRGRAARILQPSEGAHAVEPAEAMPEPADELKRHAQRRSGEAEEPLEVPREHAWGGGHHRAIGLGARGLPLCRPHLLPLDRVRIGQGQVALEVVQPACERVAEPSRRVELLVALRQLLPRVFQRLEQRRQHIFRDSGSGSVAPAGGARLREAAVEERVRGGSDIAARASEKGLQRGVANVAEDGPQLLHDQRSCQQEK